jgi:glycosyltransferase involved in cell wall biosynthesis
MAPSSASPPTGAGRLPRISIITAALNPGPEVAQTMQSVLEQGYVNLQYIFVDGGSRPQCFATVERWLHGVSLLIREPDDGISDAWNKALAAADGDIIGLINADDYLLPGTLHKVAAAFGSDADMTIMHGNARRIEGDIVSLRRPMPWPLPLAVRIGTPVVHPATFVARGVYRRVGGFDTRYRVAMDYDFVLRAYLAGARFVHLDEPLVGFRGGGLSDRKPLEGFREVRHSQLAQGLNRPTVELLHAAKMTVRRFVRPLLGRA